MAVVSRPEREGEDGRAVVRTFLIGDIRGYTTFTRERGDEAAARLASKFAELAREAVEARGGEVIELRGDEALAVFDAIGPAIRAAVELQATCREETASDPELPLPVGIGIDTGEAVPVEDGFRGRALNMAARLCSAAAAGEVLVTRTSADACPELDGIRFDDRGTVELKGFDAPVGLVEAVAPVSSAATPVAPVAERAVPPELEAIEPLVGREHELRWLRGTWRRARRSAGAVVVVSGAAGIGKTRLLAEAAGWASETGEIRYVGAGGTGTARAVEELDRLGADGQGPALLVVDDLDALGEPVAEALARLRPAGRPVLVAALVRDLAVHPSIGTLVAGLDADGHRALGPLDAAGVADVVRSYVGEEAVDAPVESMLRASGGVPARVHEVVSDWARDEVNRRLAAAAEYLAEGRSRQHEQLRLADNVIALRLARRVAPEMAADADVCPYRGLAPFETDNAAEFFGRERMIGELAARTVGAGMLGVVGPSGSGKSSVVLAGLLPSLAARILPGSDRWRATVVRPGDDPMAALGSSLDADGRERTILVVDQFEELFTGAASDEDRAAFVDALTTAAAEPERACVVLTIRADYYGRCAAYLRLAELLASNQVLVGPMTADELARAIEMPARRSGLFVERALTEALVAEVVDEPGGLPLLSTALVELWQSREDGWLRLRTYEQTGGVHGAVARLAEESFGRLEGDQREAARAILLRLVGEGEGDTAVRRRVPLTEFDHTEAVDAVLARFTADRLLTADDGNVEVAHEALIREWPRLRAWLDEDAQGRQLRAHVTQAAKQWDTRDRDPAELYRGSRLSVTLDWSARHGRELNDLEREFLSESREASERDAVRQRRTNRRLRGLLVGVAVFLVIAILAGALALVQRGNARRSASRAERSARVALSHSLGAQAVIDPQLDQAMLLARESMNLSVNPQTKSFLVSTLQRSPQAIGVFHLPEGVRPISLALSPDGRTLAVGQNSGDVAFKDTTTGSDIPKPIRNGAAATAYTPDGSEIATIRNNGPYVAAVDLSDAASHARATTVDVPADITNTAYSIALGFSPDGRTMVVGSDSQPPAIGGGPQIGYLMRVDVPTGRPVGATITVPGGVASVGFADGGRTIVTVGGKTNAFDAATGRPVGAAQGFGNPMGPTAALSADGRLAAAQDANGDLQVLDRSTGKVSTLASGVQPIVPMLFTPDGRTLVTGSDNGLVQVWDVRSHSLEETLTGHGGPVHQLAIGADGSTLYSGSTDGTIFVWDLSGSRSFGRETHVSAGDNGDFGVDPNVSLSPDGSTIATGQTDGTVVIADARTLRPIRSIHAMDFQISAVSYSTDGKSLVVAGGHYVGPNSGYPVRGDLAIWSVGPHPALVRTLQGMDWESWVTFTPDGHRVVGGGGDNVKADGQDSGAARVAEWDAATGKLVAPPVALPTESVIGVATNADGTLVAAGLASDKAVLVDPVHGRVLRTIEIGGGAVFTLALTRDERTLAAGNTDGFVRLVSIPSGKPIGSPIKVADGLVTGVQFDPTGHTLLTVGGDGSVRLYGVGSQREIGNPFASGSTGAGYGVFTQDGRMIVMFDDGEGAVWPATLGAWEAQACSVAGRSFTSAEWAQFVGPAYPHAAICS